MSGPIGQMEISATMVVVVGYIKFIKIDINALLVGGGYTPSSRRIYIASCELRALGINFDLHRCELQCAIDVCIRAARRRAAHHALKCICAARWISSEMHHIQRIYEYRI